MSKSSSKNLSNENKHWCFCCLQDKTWIKMPIVWKHRVFWFFITEILWWTFWRNKWQSVFDIVKDSSYCVIKFLILFSVVSSCCSGFHYHVKMLLLPSMSKQSDGEPNFIRRNIMNIMNMKNKLFAFVDDSQVDCNMKLFQPLSISYTDFTDWNWNST